MSLILAPGTATVSSRPRCRNKKYSYPDEEKPQAKVDGWAGVREKKEKNPVTTVIVTSLKNPREVYARGELEDILQFFDIIELPSRTPPRMIDS